MFFDDWDLLLRTLLNALVTYVLIVLILRLSGKRTLAKWNAFDFVVTIALGSMVATTIISHDTSIAEGGGAMALLVLLQWSVTSISVRAPWFRRVIKGDPTLLFRNGEFLYEVMEECRVTESEILAAMRAAGIGEVATVDAVVLENDGGFSVIGTIEGSGDALRDVEGWKRRET